VLCVQADLFYHTGRFADAEPLIRQALAIAEVRRHSIRRLDRRNEMMIKAG
jgi:hypothetical protein